jgi:hypothetical protein
MDTPELAPDCRGMQEEQHTQGQGLSQALGRCILWSAWPRALAGVLEQLQEQQWLQHACTRATDPALTDTLVAIHSTLCTTLT